MPAKHKVFYCLDCKKTFTASSEELKKAHEEYERQREIVQEKMLRGEHIYFPVNLVINGHARWIYREDENYSEVENESIDSQS